MTRVRATATSVVLALLIAAVCSSTALAGGLSKEEFITASDNICRQADQFRDEVFDVVFADVPQGEQPTPEQLTAYVDQIDPINRQQLDGIRELPVTSGEKKKVKRILKAVEKAFDAVVDDPGVLLSSKNPFAKADKLAKKYGFKVCGSSDE